VFVSFYPTVERLSISNFHWHCQ